MTHDLETNETIPLTTHIAADYHPALSPDGTKIAFTSWREEREDIFVMDIDGSNLVNLTKNLAVESRDPSWSLDGSKIAFTTGPRYEGDMDISVMNADGSNIRKVLDSPGRDSNPCWIISWP